MTRLLNQQPRVPFGHSRVQDRRTDVIARKRSPPYPMPLLPRKTAAPHLLSV